MPNAVEFALVFKNVEGWMGFIALPGRYILVAELTCNLACVKLETNRELRHFTRK